MARITHQNTVCYPFGLFTRMTCCITRLDETVELMKLTKHLSFNNVISDVEVIST